ncbi:hypothetical protein BOW49_12655 [Solemya velum gill symbiont]|uniref:PAS domain S-box protein n=1 Tax=Solemya velum gill symbiont TaxID=2340 RepID=UPI000998027A|nr:PAS domain S-box protein [Solemya velum gill symbiont]OOZ71466.1 hypothetical protein BOW49_12655 [Solemya velum gill symbiont]
MKKPAIPKNEAARQQALCGLGILDTPNEARFDRITYKAQQHFQVSIALISLVDDERQWFKSNQGLDATETPRDMSFCGHAILSENILYVPNALEDSRFADNPLVTGYPNIRFYAGAPLHAPDGSRIGILCIIDDKPRELSTEELAMLRQFADAVEVELKQDISEAAITPRRLYPIAIITMILGGLLALVLFFLVWQIEQKDITAQLQTQAQERSAALAVETEVLEDILHGMAGLFAVSDHVDGESFNAFLSKAFPRRTEIHAAVWLEYIDAKRVDQLIQQAAVNGYPDFRLRELDENNQLVDARQRQQYLAVYHTFHRDLEPWLPQGLNLAPMPAYNKLLQQGIDDEQSGEEWRVFSIRHKGSKKIELYLPVYEQSENTPEDVSSRYLRGFVGILVDVADSVEAAYQRYVPTAGGLDFYVVEIDPMRREELLYFHASRTRTTAVEPLPLTQLYLGRNVSIDMDFADTRWRMVLHPIPGSYEVELLTEPWLVLGTSLLIAFIFAGYLNTQRRGRDIIAQQVRTRTTELANSREEIRSVVDTVVDGIITIDANGVVKSFNPAAEAMFGYTADEVISHNIKMLMPEPYQHEHDGYLHNYLNTGEKRIIGYGREVQGKRKGGSIFELELAVSEMQVKGKSMFTGIVRDISQRKAMELSTKRYEAIIQSSDDAIVSQTLDGIITSWNPGAEKLFGYRADEVIGRPMLILLPPEREKEELNIHARIAHGESVETFEAKRLHKDGSTLEISVTTSTIIDDAGKVIGISNIARDISERKRLERMKSEFVSTVSHELRTPLTSIRGALGLVLGKAAEQLPDKARSMLEMAERNSERLTLLINDILDLEKIESGRLEFEFATMDLLPLAKRALEDNEGYAHKHQVQLHLQSDLTQAQIHGDAHRLLQVFANLISNAVKYSPQDDIVEISVSSHNDGFRVTVRDHGSGIPKEFRSRIFQRFAQADSSDTRDKSGTGLGLSITKAIVERHGGRIGYTSEVGVGTEFYFDLPAVQAIISESPEHAEGDRILICEDNADVAAILAEMLMPKGVISDIAATAGAARTLLAKHDYRLLLLDLTLPDMDGLEFLQELRNDPANTEMPVIVVSGRAEEGRMAFRGDAVAVVDWIQKPLQRDRLERALHEALRHDKRQVILHVEDDPDIVQVTGTLLEDTAEINHVNTLQDARKMLAAKHFDLVLLDLGLPDGSGLDLLDELKGHCPVVIFSAETPGQKISEQVSAALTKSLTSNEQLLETIINILGRMK